MKCPYCGNEMRKGEIHRDRYALKWISDGTFSILGMFAKEKIYVGDKMAMTVIAHYSDTCDNFIIDNEENKKINF